MMLDRFRIAKQKEIKKLLALQARRCLPPLYEKPRPSFMQALLTAARPAIIAEFKRASPSLGDINLRARPLAVAEAYRQAGAAALSVLTEAQYFKGDMQYLARFGKISLPLLRKDFILHPVQVRQSAASPASALLLIVRMLDETMLEQLLGQCRTYGLEAVLEVFDARDLARARKHGARIIQVNNRNLSSLKVDIDISRQLISKRKAGEVWISASGISTPEHVRALGRAGFDALLIGSSLMGASDPGRQLRALREL